MGKWVRISLSLCRATLYTYEMELGKLCSATLPSCLSRYKKSNLISSDVWEEDLAVLSSSSSLRLISFVSFVFSLSTDRRKWGNSFFLHSATLGMSHTVQRRRRRWFLNKFTHGEKVSITTGGKRASKKGKETEKTQKKSNYCCCWRGPAHCLLLHPSLVSLR